MPFKQIANNAPSTGSSCGPYESEVDYRIDNAHTNSSKNDFKKGGLMGAIVVRFNK